jgi:ribosomal protein S18 acetylase RimI-like enzyme
MNPLIRPATPNDLPAMAACDALAEDRREWLTASLDQATCLVAEVPEGIAGFLVLERRFFGHAFVSLLVVHPQMRRKGHALALLEAAEALCQTGKFFTSTNVSNIAAQELFHRAGFQPSGVITNLDEGDDEMIYYKSRNIA